ncbi:hypothetical protein CDD82_3575 [Ophiocordyceps australis]|uniref:Uncharacterized protein n=1 Tax=Ophiocordyceps australis TaxID=1399860 RepID=A0A2C5ZBV7_9HYPO|nr:hypothetical protein CDD82_3575 [Ophiocordyceps australis]
MRVFNADTLQEYKDWHAAELLEYDEAHSLSVACIPPCTYVFPPVTLPTDTVFIYPPLTTELERLCVSESATAESARLPTLISLLVEPTVKGHAG